MLNALLFIFVLLILAMNLHIIYRRKLSVTLTFCFLAVPMLFYIAGIIGNLIIGYYVLGILLVSSSVYAIFRLARGKEKFVIEKRTRRTLILFSAVVVFAILISAYHAKELAVWDFYYFYARALKAMVLNHELYLSVGKELMGSCITYPPFYILYWYIPAGLTQQVSVSGVSFLNSVFLYVFLLPFVDDCLEKKTRASYWIVAAMFLLPNIYQVCVPYTSLFLDAPMGMLFGFLLCASLFLPKDGLSRMTICLAAAALALFKPAGIFFSIVAAGIILLNLWYETKHDPSGACSQKARTSGRVSSNLIFAVAFVVVLLISYGSWSLLLRNAALNDTHLKITTSDILQLVTAPSAEQFEGLKGLIFGFMKLFNLPSENQPSLFLILSAIGVLWGIRFILNKDTLQRKKLILCTLILGISLILYIVGLFYTSIFVFIYEKYTLASFHRYCSSFFIGVCFLLCVSILFALSENEEQDAKSVVKDRNRIIALVMVVLMMTITSFPGSAFYNESSPIGYFAFAHKHPIFFYNTCLTTPEVSMEEEEAIFLDRTKGISEDSKVCVLTSSVDTAFYYVEFIQFPRICQGGVLVDYTDTDRTAEHSLFVKEDPAALLDRLKLESDYVYLINVDETMKQNYGSMFQDPNEITDHTLYKVETTGKATLLARVS